MCDHKFACAIALTSDHALMAGGFLAKFRTFHPSAELFVFTDEQSREDAAAIGAAFDAHEPIVVDKMGFDCSDWGPIVTSKLRIFDLPTEKPVLFLDVDQIITRPLCEFIEHFVESDLMIAGGADDEMLGSQFRAGEVPEWLDPFEDRVINTGAFIVRTSPVFAQKVRDAITRYSGRSRLPTQGLINGLLYEESYDFELFGKSFMIGPFDTDILNNPPTAALLHLWTPRPPFMFPNPKRERVDGNLTWEECVAEFEMNNNVEYPYRAIKDLYLSQIELFETTVGRILPFIMRPDDRHDYRDFSI